MGLFSFKTSDTNESILHTAGSTNVATVYLIQPEGDPIAEQYYEGYGNFGGVDCYVWLAEHNTVLNLNNTDFNELRSIGIELFFSGQKLLRPLKFSYNCNANYNDLKAAVNCPLQGFKK